MKIHEFHNRCNSYSVRFFSVHYCNHNVTINVLGKTHILITTHAVTSFERRTLWSSLNLTEIENSKIAENYNSVLTEQLGSTDVDERCLELKSLICTLRPNDR